MLIHLFDRLWYLASSPILSTLGSIASIVGISPLFWKYAVRPLWLRRNDAHTMTLEHEHAYLRDALQDLNRIDKPYWDDKLFTPLEAATRPFAPVPPEFLLLSERSGRWLDGLTSRVGSGRSTNLTRLLLKHRDPVVVLGDPGAGKSMAIRHAMRRLIKNALRWHVVTPRLPLYVPCSYYTATDGSQPASVEAFVSEYVTSTFAAFKEGRLDFEEYLRAGRFCIFFDALDEMPRADYAERVAKLREFAFRYSSNRVHFSCRTLDYDSRLQVAEVRIRPFDDRRRKRFLKRGLRRCFPANAVRKWIYQLETDGRLADLISNPFFAQLVVFYVIRTKQIPSNRYQLLSLFVKTRLSTDEHRIAGIAGPVAIEHFLGPLAYEMATSKGFGTSLPSESALKCIERHLGGGEERSSVMDAAKETGLLTVSPSGTLVQFSHHRLQEYFAAVYAVAESKFNTESVVAYADDLWWREILIMMAGIEGVGLDVAAALGDAAVAVSAETLKKTAESCLLDLERAATTFKLSENFLKTLRLRLADLDMSAIEELDDREVIRRLTAVIALSQDIQRENRRYENARRFGRLGELWIGLDGHYADAIQAVAEAIKAFDSRLAAAKRAVGNRCAVALACISAGATNAAWPRLKTVSVALADHGEPHDQVKMVRELIAFDDDEEVAGALRRLYSTSSLWVRREVFSSLLRYRIPHVGFDWRTVRYLWSEFGARGSTSTAVVYFPQLARSFVKVKALSVAGALVLAHIGLIVLYAGLFPLLNYFLTLLPKEWKRIVKPELVVPSIAALVVILILFDLLRVPKIRENAALGGVFCSLAIWLLSAAVNATQGPIPASPSPPLPKNLFFTIVGLGIVTLIAAHLSIVVYGWVVDGVRMRRIRRMKRSLGRRLASGQLGTTIAELATEYEKCTARVAKQLVIEIIRQCTGSESEQAVARLTELAQAEQDRQLPDTLWSLISDVEMQALRA